MKHAASKVSLLTLSFCALLVVSCAAAGGNSSGNNVETASQNTGTGTTDNMSKKSDETKPQQPCRQPQAPPGLLDYSHARVDKELVGKGRLAYWVFRPADPTPETAPVVLFLHGWRGTNPRDYGGWIEHLARKGNIVLYPIFEESFRDSAEKMMGNAIDATRLALDDLKRSKGIRADLEKFFVVGHSLGGGLTAQITARAKENGLPIPLAIMPTQPGWRGGDTMPTDKLNQIPPSVLMLVVIGEGDQFGKTRHGRTVFDATPQIPAERKRYVILPSDDHGDPPMSSDHASPLAPLEGYGSQLTPRQKRRRKMVGAFTGMKEGVTDALDYWGYWRLFDRLCEAGVKGGKIDDVIGTDEKRSLGVWSDGTPVKPMIVEAPK